MRWRLGCAACAAAVLLVIGAAPADAHLPGTNATPTNYRTRILAVSPPIPGLAVRVAEIGGALELINRTGQQVVVLGARLEPYLRVEADGGVDENRRSPTWLASRPPGSPKPRSTSVDVAAPADWQRVSRGVRVVWHDHRAHWTGADPPQVRRAPQRRQVVIPRWQVPLRVGDQTVVITGEVVWVPGSSWWPWLAVAGALAAVVGAAGRMRRWRLVVVMAVAVAVTSDIVHTVGALLVSIVPVLARMYTSSPSAAGWLLGGLAAYWLLRRPDAEAGLFLLLAAGFFAMFAGGLADVLSLGRSQVSTALPVDLARATVAASLGLGAGMVIVALLKLPRSGGRQTAWGPCLAALCSSEQRPDAQGPDPGDGRRQVGGRERLVHEVQAQLGVEEVVEPRPDVANAHGTGSGGASARSTPTYFDWSKGPAAWATCSQLAPGLPD